jgi:putative membrane protein
VRALLRVVGNAVGLWVASLVVPGLSIGASGSTGDQVVTYLVLGLLFGLVNLLVRPVVKLLALPLYVLTLGLFAFVVNALMLELTSWLSGFTLFTLHVDRFFWSAVLGALVVSLVSWALALLVPDRRDQD